MGCINCRKNYQESEIILSLIDKRRKIKLQENQNYKILVDIHAKYSKHEHFYDINNESKLINYLDSIKDDKNVYDYELLLYFDVLSIKNKYKCSKLNNFISCADIYQNLIDL